MTPIGFVLIGFRQKKGFEKICCGVFASNEHWQEWQKEFKGTFKEFSTDDTVWSHMVTDYYGPERKDQ